MDPDIISKLVTAFGVEENWPYESITFKFESNPFVPKFPNPRLFSGYEEEINRVATAIKTNTNCFIIGALGTGKTVMAETVSSALQQVEGYCPINISVQPGRYEKMMAEAILRALGKDYNSHGSVASLYEQIKEELKQLALRDVRVVIFFDEIIAASHLTLRRVLGLNPGIHDWEPILVFNGTAHVVDEIRDTIAPLHDRIGDYVNLNGLDLDAARNLVHKRVRNGCKLSDWNEGLTCGEDCSACIRPFTEDAVALIQDNLNGFPRHLVNELKQVIETAAKAKIETIGDEFAGKAIMTSVRSALEELVGTQKRVVDMLFEKADSSLNGIADELKESTLSTRTAIENLVAMGVVRPIPVGRSVKYALMPKIEKFIVASKRA